MNKPERIFIIDEKGCQLNLLKSPKVFLGVDSREYI